MAFSEVFSQLSGQSCTSAVCPRSFLCAWCQKLHCRGLVVLMTLDGSVMVGFFFAIFSAFFCFFQRRFGRGRFSCKSGRDMAGKIPTTFAVSCSDFHFFFFFSLFSPFPLLPSFFFTFFLIFPIICLHLLRFSAFSDVFSSKRRVSL